MTDIIWIMVIVFAGLIGGYLLLMMYFNMEKVRSSDVFFASWIFRTDNLNDKGKFYRRALFIYWVVVIILVSVFESYR